MKIEQTVRWPHRVFAVGEEPDPRFTFSNERTLLSWIRTGLALAAAGVVLDSLVSELPSRLRTFLAAALLIAAAVASVGGYLRWMNSERALRTSKPLPPPLLAAVLAVGIGLLGLVGFVAILTHP